jgi:hypothetical protein
MLILDEIKSVKSGPSQDIWRRRLASRSVLLLHSLFLMHAVGLWLDIKQGDASPYAKLHSFVAFVPMNPDTVWTVLCVIVSAGGMIGWWKQRSKVYLLTLIFSAVVLARLVVVGIDAGVYTPTFVWITLALYIIIEVELAPRDTSYLRTS